MRVKQLLRKVRPAFLYVGLKCDCLADNGNALVVVWVDDLTRKMVMGTGQDALDNLTRSKSTSAQVLKNLEWLASRESGVMAYHVQNMSPTELGELEVKDEMPAPAADVKLDIQEPPTVHDDECL